MAVAGTLTSSPSVLAQEPSLQEMMSGWMVSEEPAAQGNGTTFIIGEENTQEESVFADIETVAALVPEQNGANDTGRKEQLGLRFEPDQTVRKLAASLLNGIGAARPLILSDLTWRLLYEDKLALAFHLASCVEVEYSDLRPRLPVWLSRALVLSRHVRHAHGEIACLLKQEFAQYGPEIFAAGNDEWNHGLMLLLVAATLQPVLLAPQTGASLVLRDVPLDDSLTQLAIYCRLIAEYTENSQALDPQIFRKEKGEEGWQGEISALKQAAESWWSRAGRMTISYPPATRVWSRWQEPAGSLYSLLLPVRRNDASKLQATQRAVEQLSDEAYFRHEVERIDRELLGRLLGDDIPVKAHNQIRQYVSEAIGFVRRWIELQELHLRCGRDESQESAEQLRSALWGYHELALEELNLFKRRRPSLWVASGVACCRRALESLRMVFDS